MSTTSSTGHVKHAAAQYPIHEYLSQRWSPRAFSEEPVDPTILRSILEAARWSASGGNLQPWFFIIGTQDEPTTFAKLARCLNESNAVWATRAPVLGLSVASTTRPNGKPNRHAWHDVGLATQNLIVQATALGLHVHIMGGYSAEVAQAEFAIPENFEPVAMFAIGYLGDPETLNDRHREGERSARARRPLAEFVFGAQWGEPSPLVSEPSDIQ